MKLKIKFPGIVAIIIQLAFLGLIGYVYHTSNEIWVLIFLYFMPDITLINKQESPKG